jgi:rRNA maturation endonuclease Nob1
VKVVVREDASTSYINRQACNRLPINWKWAKMLEKVEGKTLEVDTSYLFYDQYNTVPVPGVSEKGLRLMEIDVERVIDDARLGRMRCNWCEKHSPASDVCPHCGKSEYLEDFKEAAQ